MSYKASTSRYNEMKYNRCGKSGLMLPAISLGLWHNFGGADDFKSMQNLICNSFDMGITHFDIANNYGPPAGSAEENFGKILKQDMQAYRDQIIISTKAGYYMWEGPYGEWGSKKYMLASLNQSLKRLNVDYVDIFYSHRDDPNTPIEETMLALDTAVRQGKALYVGISNYNKERTKQAYAILKELKTPFIINQPSYSMLNRWVEEDGLKDYAQDIGIGIICFSPLAQGLLTDKYINGVPEDSRMGKGSVFLNKSILTLDVINKINNLNTIALNRGQTLAQMALSWLLKDGKVTSVLVGASKVSQIAENVDSIKKTEFTTEELEKINKIIY